MLKNCTFCGSNKVNCENGLAQCSWCFRSWMYKKNTEYDFDDMFGDLDDLLPPDSPKLDDLLPPDSPKLDVEKTNLSTASRERTLVTDSVSDMQHSEEELEQMQSSSDSENETTQQTNSNRTPVNEASSDTERDPKQTQKPSTIEKKTTQKTHPKKAPTKSLFSVIEDDDEVSPIIVISKEHKVTPQYADSDTNKGSAARQSQEASTLETLRTRLEKMPPKSLFSDMEDSEQEAEQPQNASITEKRTAQCTNSNKAPTKSLFPSIEDIDESVTTGKPQRPNSIEAAFQRASLKKMSTKSFLSDNEDGETEQRRSSGKEDLSRQQFISSDKKISQNGQELFPTNRGRKRKIENVASEESESESNDRRYGLRKRQTIEKNNYFIDEDRNVDEDDDDDYIEEAVEEYDDDDDNGSNFFKFLDEEEQSLNQDKSEEEKEEEENDDYEVYESNTASRKIFKGTHIIRKKGDKRRKTGSKPTNQFNPFILFNQDIRKEIKEEHPNSSGQEISKIIGQLWKTLDFEKKEAYIKRSKEKAQEFRNQTQTKNIPKPPPNVWILYCKQEVAKIREESPNTNLKEASKIASQRWKMLSEEEKDVHKEIAQKARNEFRAKYPNETKAFYAKMSKNLKKTRERNKSKRS